MEDYENICKKEELLKAERGSGNNLWNIIVFVFLLFLVLYSFYAAVYIAGDHEHVITVTCKEEIHNEEKVYYYIYGTNEKGKESVYEIGSRWVEERKGHIDENVWVQIKEGENYRVRATGLCWGIEAEPLIYPITIVPYGNTSFVNDVKNPVIILGIVLAIILVFSSWFLFSHIGNENFMSLMWDPDKIVYRRRCRREEGGLSGIGLGFLIGLGIFLGAVREIIIKLADIYYLQ